MPDSSGSFAESRPQPSATAISLRIFSAVLLTFICYLAIGIPLAVLPGYINSNLGYSSFIAGLGVSIQYAATLLTRPFAGRSIDSLGPKRAVLIGLSACIGSGIFLLLTALFQDLPLLSLLMLAISRMVLGFAESMIGSGAMSWGIGQVGTSHTPRIIAWNGVATYSAIAVGAPLGVAMEQHWGLISLAVLAIVLPIIGYLIARAKTAVAIVAHGEALAFRLVLWRVLPMGLGLCLGTIGFGSIATFITLYYKSFSWAGAAYCLSAFGFSFVCVRLLLAHTIHRFGGFRVAIVSYPIEFAGLMMIWLAPSPAWTLLGAALTGAGFSMIFPALAVEAMALVPSRNRGAAISAYSLFFDISLGITGPVAGLLIGQFGYPSVYLFAAMAALLAFAIVIRSSMQPKPEAA
ncbi:MAG TPA: MFS transporter [Herbaspirillum sp.]|jgi:MFS family permease